MDTTKNSCLSTFNCPNCEVKIDFEGFFFCSECQKQFDICYQVVIVSTSQLQ